MFLVTVVASLNAQTDAPNNDQFWGAFNFNYDVTNRFRFQGITEKHNGEDGAFAQWKLGAYISYRRARRLQRLLGDNDEENQHNLTVAAGYEFISTDENRSYKREHRLVLQSTPRYLLPLGFLVQDRNRGEFRWTNAVYNFRYRNKLQVDRSFKIDTVRIIPFATGELFWDRNRHAWNQNQFAFGVALPFRKLLRVETYYKRQNCTTCTTDPLNIIGATVIVFTGKKGG